MSSPAPREQREREGQPAREPPSAAARPATPASDGKAMAYGQKRKTPEQEPSAAKDQLQLHEDCTDLVGLAMSKLPLLCNNYHKRALLMCTILRYLEMQDQEEAAQGMSQGAPSSWQRGWEDLPESSNGAGTASSVETGKEPPDAWQPTAFGTGHRPDPTFVFSGQSGGQGACDGSLLQQPLSSVLEETYSMTDPGKGPHPDTEEPASSAADAPLGTFSEDPSPSTLEEITLLESPPQEDPFSSIFLGSFEILAANSLSDGITSGDLFADIDISEFETTPAPLLSGEQGPPVNTEQDPCGKPQAEPLPLPTWGPNEREDWEYSVE